METRLNPKPLAREIWLWFTAAPPSEDIFDWAIREITAAGCITPDKKAAATTIIKTNNLNLLTDLRAAAEPEPGKNGKHQPLTADAHR